jgi:hypothetical protein
MDIVELMRVDPQMLIVEPIRVIALMDKAEAPQTWSKIDRLLPMLNRLCTENEEPMRMNERKLKLLPTWM